jgi:hypothetical protein
MEMNMDGRASTEPQWCVQQDMRNRATLEALNQIAADVGAVKGKKNLIWFSAGFPTITDPSVTIQPDCVPPEVRGPHPHGIEDESAALLKTYALLNAFQVAVYPIGARPLGTAIPNPIGPGPLANPGSRRYMEFVADEQLSFESMAEATDGAAFYNTNDLAGAVAQAVDNGANYYTISYVPPGQKYDYGHHTIDIAVNQPGLHLVYRKTYDAVDPATIKPLSGLTLTTTPPEVRAGNMQAAMSRSMPTSQQLLFDVEVEPSTLPPNPADPPGTILGTLDPLVKANLKGKSLARYSFQYAIPASQITFSPGPSNTHHGSLSLNLAAYDTDGRLVTGLSQTVTMPLSDARYQQFVQSSFRFPQQLDLPPGQLFLRIGVLDPASNKTGTLEIPLTVPKQ